MPAEPSLPHRVAVSARWPLGVLLTSAAYVWRITPMKRRELDGDPGEDAPPAVPAGADLRDVQAPEDGYGPLLRRRYRVVVGEPRVSAAELVADVARDLNVVAPGSLAHFTKTRGDEDVLAAGDEFSVRMPGPWNGPVRVIERTPTSFRFATLRGHIEAGQIEWRARDEADGRLAFEIESWSCPGDRASHLLHHRLRMAKEVQLHMWTSVLERVARRYGGHRAGPLDLETRSVELRR